MFYAFNFDSVTQHFAKLNAKGSRRLNGPNLIGNNRTGISVTDMSNYSDNSYMVWTETLDTQTRPSLRETSMYSLRYVLSVK